MGMDVGGIIRIKSKEGAFDQIEIREFELFYMRKCWSLSGEMQDLFVKYGLCDIDCDCTISRSHPDFFNIVAGLADIAREEYMRFLVEPHNPDAVWTLGDYLPIVKDVLHNLLMFKLYLMNDELDGNFFEDTFFDSIGLSAENSELANELLDNYDAWDWDNLELEFYYSY